jgi:predicted MFS family arabinose efflux permease
LPSDAAALQDRAYAVLSGEDTTERACEAIPDGACTDVPRNYLLNVANGACTKLAEQLASPGLVLPWLLAALGAPAVIAGYLLPLKQAGSLLPQMAVAARIRGSARRKWWWAAAGATQAVCLLLMIPAALALPPVAAGIAVAALVLAFSVASGVGSVAFQDVQGKTVPKGRRGRLLANRATIGGALTLIAAAYLRFGLEGGEAIWPYLALIGAAAILWALGALLFALIAEVPGAQAGGKNTLGEARRGWRLAGQVPAYRTFLWARALLLAVEIAMPFFVLHAQDLYGERLSALAVFVFAVGLANVVSSPFWGPFSDRSAAAVLGVAGLVGALAAGLALALALVPGLAGLPPYSYALVFFLLGLAEAGVRLGRKTYLVDAAPKDERPLYVAFSNTAIGGLALVAGLAGLIADLIGPDALIAVVGAVALAGALVGRTLPPPERFQDQAAKAQA